MLYSAAPAGGRRIFFEPDLGASNLKLLKEGVSEKEVKALYTWIVLSRRSSKSEVGS